MQRVCDLDQITNDTRKAILLTLYTYGFNDEIIFYIHSDHSGISDKDTFDFFTRLMVSNNDASRVFFLISLLTSEHMLDLSKSVDTFKPLIEEIIEKGLASAIFKNLVGMPEKGKAAFEDLMKSSRHKDCYILFLIYTSRLQEASDAYDTFRQKSGHPNALIELLLKGRDNSMPADFKLTHQGEHASYHYADASMCNRKPITDNSGHN